MFECSAFLCDIRRSVWVDTSAGRGHVQEETATDRERKDGRAGQGRAGKVGYGTVWYGMVWYGMVWQGRVR